MPATTPSFVMLAGVNGAGKSTLAKTLSREGHKVIAPDSGMQAALLGTDNPTEQEVRFANRVVGEQLLAQVAFHIASEHSFILETVLASDRYKNIFSQAKDKGYKTTLLYLGLPSIDDSLSRISERVSKGGHDVAGDLISWSWRQSWDRFRSWAPLFDQTIILSCKKDPIFEAYLSGQEKTASLYGKASLPELSPLFSSLLQSGWTINRTSPPKRPWKNLIPKDPIRHSLV